MKKFLQSEAQALVAYALRTEPRLLRAGKAEHVWGSPEAAGLADALRDTGQRTERTWRSRTLRHAGRAESIGGAGVLVGARQRTEEISRTDSARDAI